MAKQAEKAQRNRHSVREKQSINNRESRIDITLIERWVACALETEKKSCRNKGKNMSIQSMAVKRRRTNKAQAQLHTHEIEIVPVAFPPK